MGSLELGRQRPQKALQESLQTPALRRPLHPGATALGVLREEEEADGRWWSWTFHLVNLDAV